MLRSIDLKLKECAASNFWLRPGRPFYRRRPHHVRITSWFFCFLLRRLSLLFFGPSVNCVAFKLAGRFPVADNTAALVRINLFVCRLSNR